MEREARCEAPLVASTARNVLLYMSTERSERWRATWIALQVMLF
ncbi:MAG: hypothetical protein JWN48_6140 [Myxococcaceae bacterium]|nr:hypothetical protein [Myxococcaceae bacterium]